MGMKIWYGKQNKEEKHFSLRISPLLSQEIISFL